MKINNTSDKRYFTRDDMDMDKKGKSKEKKNESLQSAAQTNAIRTNYFKGKIDKSQKKEQVYVMW